MNTWTVFQELDRIREDFDHAFGRKRSPFNRLAFLPAQGTRRYPKVNLYEEKEGFRVEALAPGIDPTQLNVSVIGNVLTIRGEKTSVQRDVKPEAFHRNERGTGTFVRSIELPSDVDTESVGANYRNGILTITLPKSEKALPRQIEVKSN